MLFDNARYLWVAGRFRTVDGARTECIARLDVLNGRWGALLISPFTNMDLFSSQTPIINSMTAIGTTLYFGGEWASQATAIVSSRLSTVTNYLTSP